MKPRLLDLFCGAGGAGVGYARAGFDVVGVDFKPQSRYPFEFHQADVRWLPLALSSFDAIHAFPPCQHFSLGAKQAGTTSQHPDLVAVTRELLLQSGRPFVIENIEQARAALRDPILLCGEHFGLGVFRHRLFELNGFTARQPVHHTHTQVRSATGASTLLQA